MTSYSNIGSIGSNRHTGSAFHRRRLPIPSWALGRKLESELRSIVVANLQAIRQARLLNRDVRFEPVKVRDYVRRFGQILREDRRGDPDSFDR
jgi:hypothetical protein